MKIFLRFLVFAPLLAAAGAQVAAHAPDGGSFEHLQSVIITPTPGAPFLATVVTDWTRLLEDSTTTTMKNHRTIARDSTGRVFQERRSFSPTGDTEETRVSALEYTDPNRHELTLCTAMTRICTVYALRASLPGTVKLPASTTLPNGAGTITREDLGQATIDNLEAQGSREITTLNPGATNGYKQPEPTIKEFWFSPRLGVNLITKRFEPRGGAQNFTFQKINLNEPNPRLFTPPADYRILHADQQ